MSFIFCINIVLGNVNLRYIPVSFMQTIKSFTSATTGCLATSTKTILAESKLHGYKFDSCMERMDKKAKAMMDFGDEAAAIEKPITLNPGEVERKARAFCCAFKLLQWAA